VLNLKVTAEGIETAPSLTNLQILDCRCGQGYSFSRPLYTDAGSELLLRLQKKA
jgi:EAL domain-containing protein (putative c-di-GMP-specific phosphodiesterase class I)